MYDLDEWRQTALAEIGSPALLAKKAGMTPARHQLAITRKFRNAVLDLSTQRFIDFEVAVRHGKALDVATPIPTPTGLRAIGEIRSGDLVYDETGSPVRVLAAHDPYFTVDAWEVTFGDGTKIVADGPHRWTCFTPLEADNFTRHAKYHGQPARDWPSDWAIERPGIRQWPGAPLSPARSPKARTTADLAAGRFRIPATKALSMPPADLPIDPYVLGVWLGDGSSGAGQVTTADADVPALLGVAGFPCHQSPSQVGTYTWNVEGLYRALRVNGLLGNKHVPNDYLHASADQRLALLQGLMDSDGGVERAARNQGRVSFTNQNEKLADAVAWLFRSLGAKVTSDSRPARLNGEATGATAYRVSSSPPFCPFRIERKRRLWSDDSKGSLTRRTHVVASVERAAPRMVRCLTVDSPSHLYLASEACIPTHNTQWVTQWGMAWAMLLFPDRDFFITSAGDELLRKSSEFIQEIVRTVGKRYGISISTTTHSLENWRTNRGGGLLAVTMGSAFQGLGFFVIGIDDPYSGEKEAHSPTIRKNRLAYYDGMIRDRLDPDGTCYVACARWHELDLQGTLIDRAERNPIADQWELVRMAAIAEAPAGAGPDWRDELGRADGEPLWPDVRSLEELERLRANNPVTFAAKSQQRPFAPGGTTFLKSTFRVVDNPPSLSEFSKVVRAWDLASTRGDGDWTVGWLMGLHPNGSIYVLDEQRGQWSIDEVDDALLATAHRDGRGVPVRWEQGKAHLGKRENSTLERLLIGYDAAGIPDMGDKQVKANLVAPHQRSGRFVLVASGVPTNPDDPDGVIMEFVKVPGGRHDDRVDAAAVGIAYFGDVGEASMLGPAQILEVEAELNNPAPADPFAHGHLTEFFSIDLPT